MSEWVAVPLHSLAEIRVSNVDKKSAPAEHAVRLCNYMDVYGNDYIHSDIAFMEATANVAEIARFKVDRGDVMLTKDSETPSDIGIPSVVMDQIDGLVCGYHLALLKPNRNRVDSVYLAKQLAADETARYFGRYAAGSTRYGLSNGAIAKTQVRLAPLPQQQKIAAILTSIDTAIEKTEALIEKYRQIKAGLMRDLFTRGVLPNGQLRPPREQAPELYQETELGWIPYGWGVSGLSVKGRKGTSFLRTGPFGSSLKGEHWVESGHPVITIGALGEGDFLEDGLLFVGERDAARLRDFQLCAGDVVFSRVADVGRSVVVRQDQAGWIMSSNLMRIAVDEALCLPDFVQMQLGFDARVKRQIRAKVTGGGREVANSEVLSQLRFAWPDVAEQGRIVALANQASSRLRAEADQKEKLEAEKLGLMQDLLTGKIQVKVGAGETAMAG